MWSVTAWTIRFGFYLFILHSSFFYILTAFHQLLFRLFRSQVSVHLTPDPAPLNYLPQATVSWLLSTECPSPALRTLSKPPLPEAHLPPAPSAAVIQWRVTLARPGSPPSDWGERTTRGQAHLLQGGARTRAAFPGPREQGPQQSRAEAQLPAWRGFWDARRGQAHGRSWEMGAEHRYAGAQPITATLPLGSRPPAGALPARLESGREGASPRRRGARSDISSKLRLGDEASQTAPYSRCHRILPRVQQPLLSPGDPYVPVHLPGQPAALLPVYSPPVTLTCYFGASLSIILFTCKLFSVHF